MNGWRALTQFQDRSLARGALDCLRQALHAFLPVREEIHILHLIGDAPRYLALLKAYRDHENGFYVIGERAPAGAIERIAQLALKLTSFQYRPPGKARYERVRHLNAPFDGARPVLSRQQFVFVES